MDKHITFIACFFFLLFGNVVVAQDILKIGEEKASKRDTKTYDIQSLDGKDQKIHIMPDYANHILKISCLRDTINIFDYWGVPPDVFVLNKNFISLEYAVRGGSDLGLGNVIILCVNENKLYESMHVLRYIDSDFSYTDGSKKFDEHSNYTIKIALYGSTKNNYKLNINIRDEVKSTSDPEYRYDYRNESILSFDIYKNVFYSIKDHLYGSQKVYHPGRKKKTKQKIQGNFPVIILGKETYYFIKDGWYSMGKDNELSEYTERNTRAIH